MLPALVLAATIVSNISSAQSGTYAVTGRGPDWSVHSRTVTENGTNRVHQYIELATGLNYTNDYGQLVESKEEISILPQGGAAATQGRHQAYFPGDIYNGVIEVVTPDGRHLKSRPLGISYDDGSNTVMMAVLTNSTGLLVGSNQVVYPDAFAGVHADLRYTYTRAGFEQDVILRKRPPSPASCGLNISTTRLQLLTEFFNTPDPTNTAITTSQQDGLSDATLKFGSMKMGRGRAFSIGGATPAKHRAPETPVYKNWLKVGTRKFLVEQIPYRRLADQIQTLTAAASPGHSVNSIKLARAASTRWLPPLQEFGTGTNQIQLASAAWNQQPGVVLDYNEFDNGYVDTLTFQAGQTYYINGIFYCNSLTIEGLAVVKFSQNSGIQAGSSGLNMTWQTTPDQPAIFTAVDDDSVGEPIDGSTGTPTGYYGNAIYNNQSSSIHDVRMFYLETGISCPYSGTFTLLNAEFINCDTAISTYYTPACTLENVLVANGNSVINNGGDPMIFENCTFDNVTTFDSYGGASEYLTNCLVVNVDISGLGNAAYYNGYGPYYSYDRFLPYNYYVFQTAARASHYLYNGTYRNIGTTGIDSALLAEFQTMTTYAPQDGGYPDTNTPDLGYHYSVNEDSDFDGLPDWWEYYWFGNYSHTGSELDATGNTLLYDYTYGLDPNIIQFTSIETANNYVNSSSTPLQLDVTGYPYYIAISVDDTNYAADAVWNTYSSSNITVNLGSTEGWHDVWIGLRSYTDPTNTVVWQWKRLNYDVSPPTLVITSPTNGTVDVPMIQLAGYSPEELDSISCDVSNDMGVVTNLDAGITSRYHDDNIGEFTTNYFECLDIPLTNGLNVVTIHAADLAGNVTVTNFSFTVDYSSKTNPPDVQITWPQDGTKVCGDSFTLDGFVNDPTVTVMAQIVDTNGLTNTVSGLVERNGRYWAENLPLSGGTNLLTLTMTDVVGNTTVTNISVIQSSLTLAMNPVTPDSDLWNATVNLTGVISDSSQAVWVNGVKGHNNGDGTWSAAAVPTTTGGVASFTIIAYEPDEMQPDGSYGNP